MKKIAASLLIILASFSFFGFTKTTKTVEEGVREVTVKQKNRKDKVYYEMLVNGKWFEAEKRGDTWRLTSKGMFDLRTEEADGSGGGGGGGGC